MPHTFLTSSARHRLPTVCLAASLLLLATPGLGCDRQSEDEAFLEQVETQARERAATRPGSQQPDPAQATAALLSEA